MKKTAYWPLLLCFTLFSCAGKKESSSEEILLESKLEEKKELLDNSEKGIPKMPLNKESLPYVKAFFGTDADGSRFFIDKEFLDDFHMYLPKLRSLYKAMKKAGYSEQGRFERTEFSAYQKEDRIHFSNGVMEDEPLFIFNPAEDTQPDTLYIGYYYGEENFTLAELKENYILKEVREKDTLFRVYRKAKRIFTFVEDPGFSFSVSFHQLHQGRYEVQSVSGGERQYWELGPDGKIEGDSVFRSYDYSRGELGLFLEPDSTFDDVVELIDEENRKYRFDMEVIQDGFNLHNKRRLEEEDLDQFEEMQQEGPVFVLKRINIDSL